MLIIHNLISILKRILKTDFRFGQNEKSQMLRTSGQYNAQS